MVWKLTFLSLNLGACVVSSLEIFDKMAATNQGVAPRSFARICGGQRPTRPIMSPSSDILVRFRTGPDTSFTGYEMFFQESQPLAVCGSDQTVCRNLNDCFDEDQVCDGQDDCLDGTDEENCPADPQVLGFCGLPAIQPMLGNDRVVGGREAIPGSWPWQASLRIINREPFGHNCGAILIHPQWLLTAGHCFREHATSASWRALLGKHRKVIKDETEELRYIHSIHVHPEYLGNAPRKAGQIWYERKVNDIALVKLNAPVTITPYVIPVCLPDQEEVVPAGTMCHVTGWGLTYGTGGDLVLKQAGVPLVNRSACDEMYPQYKIGERMLCAGYVAGGHDACSGDSGGPLVHQKAGRWQLAGVVSTGGICAAAREPGIYTEVSQYIDWIRNTIQLN